MLAGSDTHDNGDANSGRDALIDALTAPPPRPAEPELRLGQLGVRIPEYVLTALDTLAFVRRRRKQQLVVEALCAYIPAELLDRCRDSAERTARGGT